MKRPKKTMGSKKSNKVSKLAKTANDSVTLEDKTKKMLKLTKSLDILGKNRGPLNTDRDQTFDGPLSRENADPAWADYHQFLYEGVQAHQNLDESPKSGRTTRFLQISGFGDSDRKSVLKAPLDWQELKLHTQAKNQPQPRSSHYSFLLNPGFRTTHREAAFHKLADKVFGMGDFVPRTTVFRHPKTNEPWSAQEYIDNSRPIPPGNRGIENWENSGDLHKLAIMEAILGHNDRNRSNALLDSRGIPQLIDNALSFDYSHRYGTPTPAYVSHLLRSKMPPHVHKWLHGLNDRKLKEILRQANAPSPIIAMASRRLNEAKRWSRLVGANPHYTQDFGSLLEAVQSHRLSNMGYGVNTDEVRKLVYDRIKRGFPFAGGPSREKTELIGKD